MDNGKTPVLLITYLVDEKTGKITMIVRLIYI